MKRNNSFKKFKNGTRITVAEIIADENRKKFYTSLGIFPGSDIVLFMHEKNGVIIKAGKTKLALAGDAAGEIICKDK